MQFISACAFVLWDVGYKRRTGNTHNYHVNEGAGASRGQLARRCASPQADKEQTGTPELLLGCLDPTGGGGGGGEGRKPVGSN